MDRLTLLGVAGGAVAVADDPIVVNVVPYTGNGGSQSIVGAGFAPNLVATKRRTASGAWRWTDSVRGVGLSLDSVNATAEATEATGVTSFDADGFSLGADTDYNTNAVSYFAFVAREYPEVFDIVTYTGTGAALNVPHGLGAVPEMIWVKDLDATSIWLVYHKSLSSPANTKFLRIEQAVNESTSATVWNGTSPTNAQFTVGGNTSSNANGHRFVAYLFASKSGISDLGIYSGTGDSSGATISCGFRPRVLIVKRAIGGLSDFALLDRLRDTSSPHTIYQSFRSVGAESILTNIGITFSPTGFQITDDAATFNDLGSNYIYAALT